ncbi:hypothetical protein R1flu_011741 [Riccia fluitans]|uniref:S-protein homolog n=1 Tax=Riccia fluitans TaxID=41844 RepID=A0ABD1Z9T8_9MARC
MVKFHSDREPIRILLYLALISHALSEVIEQVSFAAANGRAQTIKFITANHMNYVGAHGAVRVRCESRDTEGVFSMGIVDLLNGQQRIWSEVLHEDGPDYIHCEFEWKSRGQRIEYDVYSGDGDHIQPIIHLWSLTEVGLFDQLPGGNYSEVINWSE